MAKSVQGARMMLKRSTTTGEIPTIPTNDDHTFGWLSTDIYLSELYTNIVDNRVFTRTNVGITEFILTDPNTGQINPDYISVPIINNTAFALLMSTGGTESIHAIPELTYDTGTTTLTLEGTANITTIKEGGTLLTSKYFRLANTNTFTGRLDWNTTASSVILSMSNKNILKRHNTAGGLSISSGNGSGSNLLIGTGDSIIKMEANITLSSGEDIHIGSDGSIYFYTNTNSTWASRKTASFNTSGIFEAPSLMENGDLLVDKYLGINATAIDSLSLSGESASSWLRSNTNDEYGGEELSCPNFNTSTSNTTFITINGSDVLEYQTLVLTPGDNRILTSNSTGSQLNAEDSLTYNGTTLSMTSGGATWSTIIKGAFKAHSNTNGGNLYLSSNTISSKIRLNPGGDGYDPGISYYIGADPDVLGTEGFRMASDGTFYTSGGVIPGAVPLPSDIRLKNIEFNLTSTLNDLLKLETIKFNWKVKQDGSHYGLIAQDVEQYFPDIVIKKQLPFHSNDNKEYKLINYTEFIPIIVNAMKEQQVMIKELKSEIEILKNK